MKISLRKVRQNLLYFGVLLILVMFTDTLWIRNISGNRFYIVIGIGIVVALWTLWHCKKTDIVKIAYFVVPIILSMMVNFDFNTLLFFRIALILICWGLMKKTDMNRLMNNYISFMVFIAMFSLICMIFRSSIVSMSIIPTIDSGTYGTKALFFTNVKIGTGNLYFLRNQGPFWEPGAYQAYLNIALMFLLFGDFKRKNKPIDILILIIAVISTISTTGYLVLGLLILAKMVTRENTSLLSKVSIASLLVVIVIVAVNNETINYLLFDKMSSSSANNISNATRLYSILQNGKGIMQNPLFGISPSKYSKLFSESHSVLGAVSTGVNTTTSLSVWALYGVVFFFVYNAGIMYFVKFFKEKFMSTLLLIVALFVIFNTENMNYSLFFTLIPFWGFYRKGGGSFEGGSNNNRV